MDKDEFDKIDSLLNAIDHPENYSEDELDEIANDPDTSGLYADLCRTRSSAFPSGQLSDEEIDRQWEKFNMRKKRHHGRQLDGI